MLSTISVSLHFLCSMIQILHDLSPTLILALSLLVHTTSAHASSPPPPGSSMPGDAFCSPCWIPAAQRPQKRRRKLPRIGRSRGSGLTPLPLAPPSRPPVTSPWQKVSAGFSWAMGVRVLLPGFRGPKIQRELRTGPGFQGASRTKVGTVPWGAWSPPSDQPHCLPYPALWSSAVAPSLAQVP